MAETVQVEVFILVSDDRDYGVGRDEDAAKESYENDIGTTARPMRMVRVLVDVPFCVPTLKGTAPPEGEASLTLA